MITLTKEEQAATAQLISYFLSRCSPDATVKELLSQIYREFMPDQSQEDSELMAQRILDKMEEYITAQELASADAGILAAYYIDSFLDGKTLKEQCVILHSFVQGLEAFDQNFAGHLNQKEIRKGTTVAELPPYTGPATEVTRNLLRTKAIQAVAHANMSDQTLAQLEQLLASGDINPRMVLMTRCDDYLFQAASAMSIYCMAKNGKLEQVPQGITMDQVVLTVCAEESMRQLFGSMKKGHLSVEQYRRKMTAVWRVIQVIMTAAMVAAGAAAVIASLEAGQFVLATVAAAMTMEGLYVCLVSMEECVNEMIVLEAVSRLELDPFVNCRSEEILRKYHNQENTLAHQPKKAKLKPAVKPIFETDPQPLTQGF